MGTPWQEFLIQPNPPGPLIVNDPCFSQISQEHGCLRGAPVEGERTRGLGGPESECFGACHSTPQGLGFLTLRMGRTCLLVRASGFNDTQAPALPGARVVLWLLPLGAPWESRLG